jgi:hypothetical protein
MISNYFVLYLKNGTHHRSGTPLFDQSNGYSVIRDIDFSFIEKIGDISTFQIRQINDQYKWRNIIDCSTINEYNTKSKIISEFVHECNENNLNKDIFLENDNGYLEIHNYKNIYYCHPFFKFKNF